MHGGTAGKGPREPGAQAQQAGEQEGRARSGPAATGQQQPPHVSALSCGAPWPRGASMGRLPPGGSAQAWPGGHTQLMGCCQAAEDRGNVPQGPPVGLLKGAGGLDGHPLPRTLR